MVPFRFRFGLAALLGAGLLLPAAPANAQPDPAPTSGASPRTSAGPVAGGPLSGYTGTFATPLPPSAAASPYVGRYYYSPTAYEAYSPVIETRSQIFMTTINYPGLYGWYYASVPAVAYNTRPSASNFYTASVTDVLPPRTVTLTPTVRAVPMPTPAPEPEATARVNVLVPSDAALYIQGVRMNETGSYREFVSPPLVPGEDYTYNLRAVWRDSGREVASDKLVHVRPGERYDVDLTRATASSEPPSTLRTMPREAPEQPGGSTLRTQPRP
jgi:uncharacterized protein (TIGR03000 family)